MWLKNKGNRIELNSSRTNFIIHSSKCASEIVNERHQIQNQVEYYKMNQILDGWCKIESTSDGWVGEICKCILKVSEIITINHNSKMKHYILIIICKTAYTPVSTVLVKDNHKSNRMHLKPFEIITINLELLIIIWNE